jgi:S1-C subfamily serine protease
MAGRLVGINTAIFSRSGGSHGIGFAIPSNYVRLFVESAIAGRKLERPWLGAKLEPVTREMAEELRLERVSGAIVTRIYDRGPAAAAGLEPGDVITAVDGHEVSDARAALYRITTRGIGNRARLDIVRKGRPQLVTIALQPPPPAGRDDVRNLSGVHPFDGARVSNIGPALADELNLDVSDGVVILSVRNGSVAERLGFKASDIIVQVGRDRISDVAQLERIVKDRQRVWALAIKRGDKILQLQVGG